ncbi:bacterial leucyl aminopeptidase, partial [Tremellales sp. Uapishka_1]
MLLTNLALLLPFLLSALAIPTQHAFEVPTDTTGFSLDLDELRLVQFGHDEPPVWISELDKIKAKAEGKRFMDITDTPTLGFSNFLLPSTANVKYSYPSPGNYSKPIKAIHSTLDLDFMKTTLTKFSSFRTRYYRSETGKDSQRWLMEQLKTIAGETPNVSIKEFTHPWGQNSLIARFEPVHKKDAKAPVTIIGAHQDSTNQWPFLPSPGADDDGSGTTSSLTAFRSLIAANYTPSTPVEFHYYSAEEGGLLGSQAIAKSYEEKSIKVLAMLQMDMTAWVKQGTVESVGIITDFVDPDLTEFVYDLVNKYLAIPPLKTKCGYACSDHSSFSKAGYQSAFSIESSFENSNHNIHTSQDTIDHPEFSFTHMREFSKLAVAFAVELAGI